jgi:hypothetical protein
VQQNVEQRSMTYVWRWKKRPSNVA